MSTINFLVLCFALLSTFQVHSNPSSRDLLDEVEKQLEELRNIMKVAITKSISKMDSIVRDLFQHRNIADAQAKLDLAEDYQTLLEELATIKNLAEQNGVDISACINNQEEELENIRQGIARGVTNCFGYATQESTAIRIDTNYRTDILINHVVVFDIQLEKCQGNFLCIEPILTEIELAMTTHPQKVDVEMEVAAELMDKLKVSVTECDNTEVAQMAARGNIIINVANACAEKMKINKI